MMDCEKPGDCAYPGCDCPEDDDPFDECELCGGCGFIPGKDYPDGSTNTERPCPACSKIIITD